MAIVMSNDVSLTVNSVDLADHAQSVVVNMNSEDLDATAMGATARAHTPGLRDDEIVVTFLQDFAANEVDATLNGLVGSTTAFTVVVKPTSAAVSATNPSYTMSCLLLGYQPIDATVGEISTPEVRFVAAPGSKITRAVA